MKIQFEKRGYFYFTPCPAGIKVQGFPVRVGAGFCVECKHHICCNDKEKYVECNHGNK